MKIYVITSGCYSDYHIDAVTDDKEKAEFLKLKFSDEYNEANIEEYDTDKYQVEGVPNQLHWKVIVFKKSKPIIRPMLSGEVRFTVYNDPYKLCEAVVVAKTKEQALKIVRDKYAQYLSEQVEKQINNIFKAFDEAVASEEEETEND